MPKISVLIAAYNAMAYLPKTLNTVLHQTYTDLEILIVNDGSTDNLVEWVQQLQDPRVRLISQSNQGLAGARNTGILAATGDYLAFLDADDLWDSTKLAKQAQLLDNQPEVGLVYCWVAYINEADQLTGRIFRHQDQGWVWERLATHNIVECGSVPLIRRSCFETLGLFDTSLRSYCEDWDMWLRIAWEYPFAVVKEPLVYYRQTPGSISRHWFAMSEALHKVVERAFQDKPEFQELKSRSLGEINLCLAWKCIQSTDIELSEAEKFRRLALSYYPKLKLYREYWRLWIAIVLMRSLGESGYILFLKLLHNLRRSWMQSTREICDSGSTKLIKEQLKGSH